MIEPEFSKVAAQVAAKFGNDEHAKVKYADFRALLHVLGHSVSDVQVDQIRAEFSQVGPLKGYTVSQQTFCKWYLKAETQRFLSESAPGVAAGAAIWTVMQLQVVKEWVEE